MDPLELHSSRLCQDCGDRRRERKRCSRCGGHGHERGDLEGLWRLPGTGFLVCGGPSLGQCDLSFLQRRGVVSLGINNAGAFARTTAWTFSDPQNKFHHALFLDPKVITLAPTPKLRYKVRCKLGGQFRTTELRVDQTPNAWGYGRRTVFDHQTFLDTAHAHWGYGGKQGEDRSFTRLNTTLLGIRLLHYLGVRTIFLLGVDFSFDQGSYAWAQEKAGGGHWHKSVEMLRRLRPVLESRGVRVCNCNATSRLEVFDHVPLADAVEAAAWSVLREPLDMADWYNKGPIAAEDAEVKAGSRQLLPLADLLDADRLQPVPYPLRNVTIRTKETG